MLDCCQSLLPSQVKRGPERRVARVQQIDLAGVAGRDQRRPLVDRAVAIDAGDGRGVARFAVKHAVAVNIEVEMAIAALHPVREMHVFQMHRLGEFSRIVRDQSCCRRRSSRLPLRSCLEDGAENPAVPVVIGKLRVLELRIEFGHVIEKILVAPESARRGCFGIVHGGPDQLGIGRIVLLLRIHEFAVGFLVPPGVTEIRIHKEISLVHVAVHALAGWNRARELMNDRMTALVFGNRRVGA